MSKSPDAFRSIGEVSRLVGVAPHVLRYWESQFSQLSPVKRADGRRYYRPDDVRLAAGLCQVMREEGLSIRGAKRLITAETRKEMKKVLTEIQDGTFASEFLTEMSPNGGRKVHFLAKRRMEAELPIEKVGAELRSMMSWLKK